MSLIIIVLVMSTFAYAADPFNRLQKEAEERYLKSSKQAERSNSANADQKKKMEEKKWKTPEAFLNDWNKRLSSCTNCKLPPEDQVIDCDALLRQHPEWQFVKKLRQKDKDIQLQKELDASAKEWLEEEIMPRNAITIACLVCAGADPNTRLSNSEDPHLASHMVSNSFQFVELLKRHGAQWDIMCSSRTLRGLIPEHIRNKVERLHGQ